MNRGLFIAAGVLGASGVLLGAFGAHALRSLVDARGLETWDTAVTYQLFHAAALLGIAVWHQIRLERLIAVAGHCMIAGVLLFSGSLYLLVLDGPRWLGPVTPVGGVLFAVGWTCVLVAGITSSDRDR